MSVHVTWDKIHKMHGLPEDGYMNTVLRAVHEGLCRALGNVTLPRCVGVDHDYINAQTFRYAQYSWAHKTDTKAALANYVDHLRLAELLTRRRLAPLAAAGDADGSGPLHAKKGKDHAGAMGHVEHDLSRTRRTSSTLANAHSASGGPSNKFAEQWFAERSERQ